MLTSADFGVIIFDFVTTEGISNEREFWEEREEYQNRLFLSVKSQLMKNPSLCKRRELAIPLEVVTFLPTQSNIPENDNLICADESSIYTALKEHGQEITNTYLKALNASFQRVSTIKPAKKRASVTKQDSKGAVLKSIEKEIANLDRWQMGAAIESPEGPQRIRGLAGSGKTVILALKAAYLHIANQNGILLLRLILVHCMSNLRI